MATGYDSDHEVERFEVTDEDLEFGLSSGLGRKRYRASKEHNIYGIWAREDSDDDERPSFSGKNSKQNYSTGIDFISGGVKQSSGEILKEKDDDASDDSDVDGAPMEMDMAGMPKHFGAVKEKKTKAPKGKPQFRSVVPEQGFGNWEKHTKGIGQKLLAKMGYEPGKGLGKNKQGITIPVEAFKRKGRAAVGAYGFEGNKNLHEQFQTTTGEEEEEEEFQEQLAQWKKQPEKAKQKVKYKYKTVEDVRATGGPGAKKKMAAPTAASKIKVIDMTGPETRVLSGYDQIAGTQLQFTDEAMPKKKAFSMPELEHNLTLLVEMTEQQILDNERRLRHEKDMIINLKHEDEKLTEVLHEEKKSIDKLEAVLEMVEECERRLDLGSLEPLTLRDCETMFRRLQEEYYVEYKSYELNQLAITVVFPLVKKMLIDWKPLLDSAFPLQEFLLWKELLEEGHGMPLGSDGTGMDVYHRLVWEIWMPHIRTMFGSWSVRNYDQMLRLLEDWLPLVPTWIMDNLYDQLVMPRLLTEVDNWNPTTDTMPIHQWLHPWLPLISPRLECLYPTIRHKLGKALTNWHPSDASAIHILKPWKPVFSEGSMDSFLLKNILPKLGLCLQEFVINPHQQHLDGFQWVLRWHGMLPVQSLTSLFEKHFFPKWIQVLCTWLSNNPDYEQVTKWYLGWKSQFPEEMLNEPAVKDQFNRALDMMNRAVGGGGVVQPGARENVAYLTSTERRRDFEAQAAAEKRREERTPMEAARKAANVSMNFKDLIQAKAEENNLVFCPIPNKWHEAKAVYQFGTKTIYMDRGVVFVQGEKTWVPVSLQNLIDMAR
ncbi:tuftelin-interacting protein 11-like [Branchiostoma floridae]|uniref:Tuftelin-interacting protein 11 n=1 Tax=Branchiostoma floridae TaxID=7739 RepID=A0A9J7HIJ0_BRAFL|nr:tuftelin-interacting protein 11-like [Branchiostoma floridae]XP_035660295.1 tuftelin-interacting protein 11-like [Branchiostoma floridae]